jgi:hypothetical protein
MPVGRVYTAIAAPGITQTRRGADQGEP